VAFLASLARRGEKQISHLPDWPIHLWWAAWEAAMLRNAYRLLGLLTTSEALDYLHLLTGKSLGAEYLGRMCRAGHINAYIDCPDGVPGECAETLAPVFSVGEQKLEYRQNINVHTHEAGAEISEKLLVVCQPGVSGTVCINPDADADRICKRNTFWSICPDSGIWQLSFKPSDIEALAEKLTKSSEAEVGELAQFGMPSVTEKERDLLAEIEALKGALHQEEKKRRAAEERLLAAEADPQEAQSPNASLHDRERRSVGLIIAVLAKVAELDLSKPYAACETLAVAAASYQLEFPSSKETVAKYLKLAVKER
jgi:hypothetical protein